PSHFCLFRSRTLDYSLDTVHHLGDRHLGFYLHHLHSSRPLLAAQLPLSHSINLHYSLSDCRIVSFCVWVQSDRKP
ncbi:hypothetical protein DPEC_G00220300, partial [Dallia pectoralis]